MTYQPPPRVADLETYGDVLRLAEYSTQLEGIAVLAAMPRRAVDEAFQDDADSVALEN